MTECAYTARRRWTRIGRVCGLGAKSAIQRTREVAHGLDAIQSGRVEHRERRVAVVRRARLGHDAQAAGAHDAVGVGLDVDGGAGRLERQEGARVASAKQNCQRLQKSTMNNLNIFFFVQV